MSFRLEDISVSFGETRILSHFSLAVETGRLEALVGPSGVGKSTVLRVIAGILQPDSGRVFIDDIDVTNVPTYRRSVGLVFQDNQLFPHLDVAANIGFGLRMAKVSGQEISRRVTHLLELVGLTGFEQRRPASLSGGEAKRVALARALAPRPRLLLLDEPLTGLDRELHDRLALDLRNILTIEGMTSLLVTHDLDEANTIAQGLTRLEAPL
jgi:thiamine transport system ATP-binding protein